MSQNGSFYLLVYTVPHWVGSRMHALSGPLTPNDNAGWCPSCCKL